MRRRVIELSRGKIVRDEVGGQYAPRDLTTAEFGALLREPAPEPHRAPRVPHGPAPARQPEDLFDDAFSDDAFNDDVFSD
jgi:cell division transport system ATP-binding protein